MHRALITLLMLSAWSASAQSIDPPQGWRYPTEADYRSSWADFRKDIPKPFHVLDDFNGDTRTDEAWILIREKPAAWAVFVYLSDGQTGGSWRQVFRVDGDKEPQDFGITLAKPGRYKTACGKGYWECKKGEPEVLVLTRPAINYFRYESASSIVYWNSKTQRFTTVAISD
jgi:hypothetical protein